MVLLGGKYTWE